MTFREAYQNVGGEVQAGTYKPDLGKNTLMLVVLVICV